MPTLAHLADAIHRYLGVRPDTSRVRILNDREWERLVGPETETDRLTGRTAAIRYPDAIYIRAGYEDSALHELLHEAGLLPDQPSADWLNEGITQAVAEAIAAQLGIRARSGYAWEPRFVREQLVPATGLSLRELARGYLRAEKKAAWLACHVWCRHSDFLSDPDEWGTANTVEALADELTRRQYGPSPRIAAVASLRGEK